MAKKNTGKKACLAREVSKSMSEQKNKKRPPKQKVAIAFSKARKRCGIAPRRRR